MSVKRRLALNLLPLLVLLVPALVCAILLSWDRFLALVGLAGVSFFYAGRFVIFFPALEQGIPFEPIHMATLVVVLDFCVGLLITINFDLLYRLPWAGEKLKGMEAQGHALLEKRDWIRRLAFFGNILYVALPFPGTGSIGGTIVGRLVGLSTPKILFAVLGGSLIGSAAMALGGTGLYVLLAPLRDAPWFRWAAASLVVAVSILLIWLGYRANRAHRNSQRFKAENAPATDG